MKRDKKWLKDLVMDMCGGEGDERLTIKAYKMCQLIDQLDEPEITEEQAWEKLAPRFSMSATELQRQVLDGFIAMTAEEIELESDKIKKLADGIKKLHAENEELKAKLEKPVIPQFVADYLETAKKEISLLRVFEIANGLSELDMWRKEYNWIRLYHLDFARAWLDGYEIEKENLYYVKLPTAVWNSEASELEDNSFYLKLNTTSDEIAFSNLIRKVGDWSGALTEKQIKNFDPRYWPFAEPVEEST